MQVDEDPSTQQLVDLILTRRVAAHQLLERGRLVLSVVIDVQRRIACEARHDEVDEAFEGILLRSAIVSPECVVSRLALCDLADTEEILETAVFDEGIPLDVKEEVVG